MISSREYIPQSEQTVYSIADRLKRIGNSQPRFVPLLSVAADFVSRSPTFKKITESGVNTARLADFIEEFRTIALPGWNRERERLDWKECSLTHHTGKAVVRLLKNSLRQADAGFADRLDAGMNAYDFAYKINDLSASGKLTLPSALKLGFGLMFADGSTMPGGSGDDFCESLSESLGPRDGGGGTPQTILVAIPAGGGRARR